MTTATELTLQRDINHALRRVATMGSLAIAGVPECVTLEDPVRELWDANRKIWHWDASFKQAHNTAIPSGRYEVIIDDSTRFGRPMPHVLDVPDFDGIRLHNGGTVADTDGCPLLGRELHIASGSPYLSGSKADAFPRFFDKLEAALALGKVYLNVLNGVPNV